MNCRFDVLIIYSSLKFSRSAFSFVYNRELENEYFFLINGRINWVCFFFFSFPFCPLNLFCWWWSQFCGNLEQQRAKWFTLGSSVSHLSHCSSVSSVSLRTLWLHRLPSLWSHLGHQLMLMMSTFSMFCKPIAWIRRESRVLKMGGYLCLTVTQRELVTY